MHFVKDMKYISEYKLLLTFENRVVKLVDLKPYWDGEIFETLKDIDYFKTVRVNPDIDTIAWENGADFAPEFLYEIGEALKSTEDDLKDVVELDKSIKEFMRARETSPAAQLLIPEPKSSLLHLGKESGQLASIAFLAWKRCLLPRLDHIINKWDIKTRGTSEFKGKLEENWLEEEESCRRNVANDTISALCELIVAEYLEDTGFTIEDMAAWNVAAADVVSRSGNKRIYSEVKYFPDSPEEYDLRIAAAKGSGVAVGSLSPPSQILNYFNYRIAQAVIQLEKFPRISRRVFLIFDESARASGRKLAEKYIGKRNEWYYDPRGDCPGVLEESEESRNIILEKSPLE